MSSKQATQQMMNFLKYKKVIAIAMNNCAKVTSFRYKKFFTVPKFKADWLMGSLTTGSSGRMYGGLYFYINGHQLRGHVQFDHAFFFATLKETQRWIDPWASAKLTRVINSIEVGASMDRARAKKIVERLYKVKVI